MPNGVAEVTELELLHYFSASTLNTLCGLVVMVIRIKEDHFKIFTAKDFIVLILFLVISIIVATCSQI